MSVRPAVIRFSVAVAATLGLATTMLPMTSASAAPVTDTFSTSFETGQPQPGYTDEAENGRAAGVEGPTPTGIGGSQMDKITDVQANGENTGAGEIATNAADGDKFTKWLGVERTRGGRQRR